MHIITSVIEYHAVLESCHELERAGFEVSYIHVDKNGMIAVEELKKTIKNNTRLISLMHANNETAKNLNLLSTVLPERVKARIRYNHEEAACRITALEDDSIEIMFDEPQFAITPGQSVVFYAGEVVLGGAEIVDSK